MRRSFAAAFAASAILCLASGGALAGHAHHSPPRCASPKPPGDRPGGGHGPAAAGVDGAWCPESGTASYYSSVYDGRRTASGLIFDQSEMTAAHPWLPFGSRVRVRLAGTDRSVVVTVVDRLHARHRVLDLSLAAARELGIVQRGVARVILQPA